jgi:hypothetical protein
MLQTQLILPLYLFILFLLSANCDALLIGWRTANYTLRSVEYSVISIS